MKVALLASTFLPRVGGTEAVVHNLAWELCRLGHDVRVVTWWGLWRQVAGRLPYPVIPLLPRAFTQRSRRRWERGRGRRWPVAAQIAWLQKVHRFDLWHVHMAYPMGILAVPVLKRMRVPVVTTGHGDDVFAIPGLSGYDVRLNPFLNRAIVEALCLSDRVTAISMSMHEEYRRAGIPERQIRDVSNGVDVAWIRSVRIDRAGVRRAFGLNETTMIVLTVGRNHPQKGYRFIPGIASELDRAGGDWAWLIVGRDLEPIEAEVRAKGLGHRVRCVPEVRDAMTEHTGYRLPPRALAELLRAADILAMPSLFEGMPVVLLEAMAAGLPAVVTDAPGCRDVVRHDITGLISAVGDPAAMAANLRRLLDDQPLRQRLAEACARQADELSWERIAAKYLTVYGEACAEARGQN